MSIKVDLIAQYFIGQSEANTTRVLTHLKLQKLVYYAQGYYLAEHAGEPLFEDKIEAWVHGPICHTLYVKYHHYDYSIIPKCPIAKIPAPYLEVLEKVWKKYGVFCDSKLEDMIHLETPWIAARGSLKPWQVCNNEISQEVMYEYFASKLSLLKGF